MREAWLFVLLGVGLLAVQARGDLGADSHTGDAQGVDACGDSGEDEILRPHPQARQSLTTGVPGIPVPVVCPAPEPERLRLPRNLRPVPVRRPAAAVLRC